jgi:hypothetical protein
VGRLLLPARSERVLRRSLRVGLNSAFQKLKWTEKVAGREADPANGAASMRSSFLTPRWSKGDSNSWSHPERQRSEGASHRPPFNSLDRGRTRLFAGEKRIRTCPVTGSVLCLPQARGDYHSAAECLLARRARVAR